MHRYTSSEFNVYVHDDVGGGRAVTAAAMLLLLQGGPGRRFMSTSSPSWPPALGQSREVTSCSSEARGFVVLGQHAVQAWRQGLPYQVKWAKAGA